MPICCAIDRSSQRTQSRGVRGIGVSPTSRWPSARSPSWWEGEGRESNDGCGEVLVIANALGLGADLEDRWRNLLLELRGRFQESIRFCHLPAGRVRWSNGSSRMGVVLAKSESRNRVSRHKVVLSTIEWTRCDDVDESTLRHLVNKRVARAQAGAMTGSKIRGVGAGWDFAVDPAHG